MMPPDQPGPQPEPERAETFGERMARLKRERGEGGGGPGRPRLRDKHGNLIRRAETMLAEALPEIAQDYLDELKVKEPERCPVHGLVLRCPDGACPYHSERTAYDHKAAAYAFDRIMGRPTARSENVLTVRLVQELTAAVVTAFIEVNGFDDAHARREAFAARLAQLGVQYGGSVAERSDRAG